MMAGQLVADNHRHLHPRSTSTLQLIRSRLRSRSCCRTRRFAQNIRYSILRHKSVPEWSKREMQSATMTAHSPLGHPSQSTRNSLRHHMLCCYRSFRHRTNWLKEYHRNSTQPHPRAKASAIHSSSPGSAQVSAGCSLHRLPRTTCILLRSRKHIGGRSNLCRMSTSSGCFQHSILPPRRWEPASSRSLEAVYGHSLRPFHPRSTSTLHCIRTELRSRSCCKRTKSEPSIQCNIHCRTPVQAPEWSSCDGIHPDHRFQPNRNLPPSCKLFANRPS